MQKKNEISLPEESASQDGKGFSVDSAVRAIKNGGGYDVIASGFLMSHGIPVPPSLIGRVRQGLGRLIDGTFGLAEGKLQRMKSRADFEEKLQQAVMSKMAKSGAENLSKSDRSTEVALSMLNEYDIKYANKAAIAAEAYSALANDPPAVDAAPDADLSLDWLNYFSDIAAQKSDPEMQKLMGQILAGEIRQPGSFSPLTIHTFATLSTRVAKAFERLCSASIAFGNYSGIPTDVYTGTYKAGIPEVSISYPDIVELRTHQLLSSDMGGSFSIGPIATIFTTGDKLYIVSSSSPEVIRVALFTSIGSEIRRLVLPSSAPGLNEKLITLYGTSPWQLQVGELVNGQNG